MAENRIRKADTLAFNIIGYIFVGLISILCLVPFLLTVSGSVTKDSSLFEYGYRLIPKMYSLEAYKLIFRTPEVITGAYTVTVLLVVSGTALGLFLTAMTSYVLHRKDFKYRNKFSFFFFFTTLFSGGLVPWYLVMINLGMKNSFLALLLPHLFAVFHIIIMRTFFTTIPESLGESAKIDGAGDFTIFLRLYLPISLPALSTIGLFIALTYWNDWYQAMLFITKPNLMPLQYHLYKVFNSMQAAQIVAQKTGMPVAQLPTETFKLAMTVVVTGPIILVYPFVQKYFVKGMTVGAVKG
ncbi:putative aldouronate transport system permease protein [Cohnella sp. OV330]|uniref:carbohydrate ABC transporter permease n=1 Tax=Cohnella sp. OV330 TaxID=1855288 RepID=UPI0008E10870|nr:carbohydrate ABC transporter permease [Cohnella sp. OV330]SFB51403.1 putative aldouronate transport system permease protein [Cohnella sp. OV330]